MIFLRPSLATFDWNKSLNFFEYTSAIYVKLDLDWSSKKFLESSETFKWLSFVFRRPKLCVC